MASGTLGFVMSKITFPRGALIALVAVSLYGGHWLLKSESATRVAKDVSMASSELRRVREELQETNSKLDAIVGVLSPKPPVKSLPAMRTGGLRPPIKPAPKWSVRKPIVAPVPPKKSIF